ncbi:uncharacterized protein BDZ99DRAFT_565519 [Mytilinidion resinicola]|uniref:Uncharacterized protein n=1 Tax=Mytilinidion resinicola TaxID=574789 RepID=A0A6A6ZAD2_9PEZI|nr:uncharacterized protein BDZ99DRAFT_565519 [Mytilinidion resinicola]KAF2817980.1 hypothetical protein BDZ99DRAFT_565519 [Mytilinidion resinicola]
MSSTPPTLLALPAELRNQIFSYVVNGPDFSRDGFLHRNRPGGIYLDDEHTVTTALSILLTCRQFYHDLAIPAYTHTHFLTRDLYSPLPSLLLPLPAPLIASIRNLAWVVGPRQLRSLVQWRAHPFDVPIPDGAVDLAVIRTLRLDTLTLVLHASSYTHYAADFTADLVGLLRRLRGVRRIVFVRNRANVQGGFGTWFNRLVGLMLKVDHKERYDRVPPALERVWWEWGFDEVGETFEMVARAPKPVMGEEVYMRMVKPLVDGLMARMEREEWEADPRARNGV